MDYVFLGSLLALVVLFSLTPGFVPGFLVGVFAGGAVVLHEQQKKRLSSKKGR